MDDDRLVCGTNGRNVVVGGTSDLNVYRTLVDPAPSRIESLVHDIAMKKLLDGQFDECRLTLRELRRIEDSLIKSLTGVYHGRIKYPDQQPA